MNNQKKIAIVYDWIDSWGGVERVLLTLHELFPEAVFYTSYYDPQKASWAKEIEIKSTFIQRLPQFIKKNRVASLLLYPYAFESLDLSTYDIVISVTSAFAKGVITKPHTTHICYLLTPPRYLWGMSEQYSTFSIFTAPVLALLRSWDIIAAHRPDRIISISNAVAERCKKYYNRQSEVLYPGFDLQYWAQFKKNMVKREEFYLVVSRLEKYKKVDVVIDAFNELGDKQLIIVGNGRQKKYLQQKANNNITFISDISDEELAAYYQKAKALIMPQEEDFGYVALEAQSLECPIIAYRGGGSLETIQENEMGIFFDYQTKESLQGALERFEQLAYNVLNSKPSKNDFLNTFSEKKFTSFFKTVIEQL